MYFTYMLRCDDGSIYTGITTDVDRRFSEHLEKKEKGAEYTHNHSVKKVEAVWKSENRATASKLEFYIKKLSKAEKEKLIKDNLSFYKIMSAKIDSSNYVRVS